MAKELVFGQQLKRRAFLRTVLGAGITVLATACSVAQPETPQPPTTARKLAPVPTPTPQPPTYTDYKRTFLGPSYLELPLGEGNYEQGIYTLYLVPGILLRANTTIVAREDPQNRFALETHFFRSTPPQEILGIVKVDTAVGFTNEKTPRDTYSSTFRSINLSKQLKYQARWVSYKFSRDVTLIPSDEFPPIPPSDLDYYKNLV